MGKLHEVLAVEGDLAGTAKKIAEETIKTFSSRADHFIGQVQSHTYFADDDMLTPAEKSDLLERVDILIRAVKKARQRANNHEAVDDNEFGARFFAFIHKDIVR